MVMVSFACEMDSFFGRGGIYSRNFFFVREGMVMMTYLVRGSVGVRFKCSYIVARS